MTMDWPEVFRWLLMFTFILVALAAARVWWRVRTRHSAWLAAAFGAIALLLVVSRISRAQSDAGLGADLRRVVVIAALLAFPYLLFRFALEFRTQHPRWELAIHVLSLGMIASSLTSPWWPQGAETRPAWFQFYVLAVLGYWLLVSVIVAVWLLRAGRGQPLVSRRRMQLMAWAAVVLSIVLLLQVEVSGDTVYIATNTLAMVSAVMFVLGFSPPRGLREWWRRPAVERLRQAESRLMAATTRNEVASSLLPPAADLLGGGGAALFGRDAMPILNHGFSPERLEELTADLLEHIEHLRPTPLIEQDRLVISLRSGWLVVQASPYAPFFGLDEIALVTRLALLVDLAWGRIELFEAERGLREELQQANRELEAIVYGLSHDLRNPLVTILGYLDVLETDYAENIDEQGRHFLRRMRASAGYMDALIRDLLELSRVGRATDETAVVDLGELVLEITGEVQRANPGLQVSIDTLPAVRMSGTRARQLFTNLIENAVRHSGRSDVHVRVTADRGEDQSLHVAVIDNGKGIPPDYREKVFGIFEQLGSKERVGTGIGLAICRKIVQQFGGSIEILDPPTTTGTQFRVTFPATMVRATPRLETAS